MPDELQMNDRTPAIPAARPRMRMLAMACAAIALIAGVLAMEGSRAARAQEGPACEVNDVGTLGAEKGSDLQANGRWTTEDCDSRFRTDSDAHTYRFEVVENGRIRIDLTSAEGDSYLYLLTEDGSRITDNDDGGANLDARIERDLAAGVYLVEATTVGGRGRGPASFSLSISRVTGCDPVHLGALEPGANLTASGSWTLDTCGSRFVVEHPAHSYSFNLSQGGRVLIDLTSIHGDPVLSLVSPTRGVIAANDDGGGGRNSRIERYLTGGVYLIEATTYLERDLQPSRADFTLVIQMVDEGAKQHSFQLKVEATHAPDQVIAGVPFPVHYRVGNLGGGDLVDTGGSVVVYVVAPRVYERNASIIAPRGRWQAGVSYHSGANTASATSIAIGEVTPFSITLRKPGPSWVFVAIIAYDESGEEVGFHGIWRNLQVLSSLTFGPVTVKVDGMEYGVSAEADAEGLVTISVSSVADPAGEVDPALRAKAIYAAGVHTQMLDGIFERPAIAALPVTAELETISVADPSSDTLLKAFADQYASAIAASGLAEALTAGEAISPVAVEELTLSTAQTLSARYASLAAAWSALQSRIDDGDALSFADAFAVQSQLAYAERVISPAVTAGEIVQAARAADLGWQDPGVREMSAGLEQQASCGNGATALRGALEAAGIADVDRLLALDAELRAALPVYSLANDGVLCEAAAVDAANSQFLRSLSIADSSEILRMFGHEPPPPPPPAPAPPPHRLRILAQLGEDGRVEHGVELSSGEQVLPTARYLPADAPVDEWLISSDVEVDGNPIGKIRARRLADGRVELGFLSAAGERIEPNIRYLPADLPAGVWLRSGEIKVPRAAVLE